jgi:putative tricarboxylic transport membrane protein
MAESSFRQAMLLSRGSLSIFWSSPLVAIIVTLALLMLFWPLFLFVSERMNRRRALAVPGSKP